MVGKTSIELNDSFFGEVKVQDLRYTGEFPSVAVYSLNDFLHCVHFSFLKINFSTLTTNPSRNIVEADMDVHMIDMKWSTSELHFTLTVHTLHELILVL
jgi:hypothetical protein